MSESVVKSFDFDVTLEKAYTDGEGVMHVIGIASDDEVDRTGDKMADAALQSMADQCKKNKIPLLDSHHSTFGIGHTHDAAIVKKVGRRELSVDFALDKRYPQATDLYKEVENGKSAKQLSIGGNINRADDEAVCYEVDLKTKQYCRVIKKITLDHIATTRPKRAAVPGTRFIQAIVKSIFDGEELDVMKIAALNSGGETPNTTSGTQTGASQVEQALAALGMEAAVNKETKTMAETAKDEMQKNLQTGIAALANLGETLNKAAGASVMPEHLVALDKAINGVIQHGVVEKNFPDVQRMVGAIHKFFGGQGRKILDGEDAAKNEAANNGGIDVTVFTTAVDKAVADKLTAAVEKLEKSNATALASAVEKLEKSNEKALVQLSEALAKGLTDLGVGIHGKVETTHKEAVERLGKLEKLSGVRQSIPGQEQVNKDENGGTRSSRAPDEKNPFRGMFDSSIGHALSQMGRGASVRGAGNTTRS